MKAAVTSVVIAATLAGGVVATIQRADRPSDLVAPAGLPFEPVPRAAKAMALLEFEAEYGRISDVLGQSPTSRVTHPDTDLWAVVVRGRFIIHGPIGPDGPIRIPARYGRVTFNRRGELEGVALSTGLSERIRDL